MLQGNESESSDQISSQESEEIANLGGDVFKELIRVSIKVVQESQSVDG